MKAWALVVLLLGTAPAAAWEFSPVPICTLSHDWAGGAVRVTHDPRLAEPYEIALTRPEGWPAAPLFSMRFVGLRGLTISTGRHRLAEGGTRLMVTDTGFGNVLNGLEFNTQALAISGAASLAIPLDGAAPAVQAFRACTETPTA